MRAVVVKNLSTVEVVLFEDGAGLNPIYIQPNDATTLHFSTNGSFCHGHSRIGSFMIIQGKDDVSYRQWGAIRFRVIFTNTEAIFEILKLS